MNLTVVSEEHPLLTRVTDDETRTRIRSFLLWSGDNWVAPDLEAYADFLRARALSEATISSYLSTIRSRYASLADSMQFNQWLIERSPGDTLAEKSQNADMVLRWIRLVAKQKVKTWEVRHQDKDAHRRLSDDEVTALLSQIDRSTITGIRNFAAICFVLGTGVREFEFAHVTYSDLWHRLEDEPALNVARGKGVKQRKVPYGASYDFVMRPLQQWREAMEPFGVTRARDWVFRSFTKNKTPRRSKIGNRTMEYILQQYPIEVETEPGVFERYTVQPHDLRYTYARRAYLVTGDISVVQRNLGHSSVSTTWKYVGDIEATKRAPQVNLYGGINL